MILGGEKPKTSTMNPTPFPELDAIYGKRLPFYDMADAMTASTSDFCG